MTTDARTLAGRGPDDDLDGLVRWTIDHLDVDR